MKQIWAKQSYRSLKNENSFNNFYDIVILSDNEQALTSCDDKTIKLWDLKTRKVKRIYSGHTHNIKTISSSSCGKYFISGSNDKTIKLWDIETSECIKTFKGHNGDICSITYTLNDQFILSGSSDCNIKLWDIETSECIKTFKEHSGTIFSVICHPIGLTVISGSEDSTIKLWKLKDLKTIHSFNDKVWKKSLAISPDGKYIASGSFGKIKIWDLITGKLQQINKQFTGWCNTLTFDNNSKKILFGTSKGFIGIIDITTNLLEYDLKGHKENINKVVYSPNNQFILSSGDDEIMKLWNI